MLDLDAIRRAYDDYDNSAFSPGDELVWPECAIKSLCDELERAREFNRQLCERLAACSEVLGKRAERGRGIATAYTPSGKRNDNDA
jgi:hypothetical protein